MLHNFQEVDECKFEDPEYTPDPSAILGKLNESCELLDVSPFKITKRTQIEYNMGVCPKSRRLASKFQEAASEALSVPIKRFSEAHGGDECTILLNAKK